MIHVKYIPGKGFATVYPPGVAQGAQVSPEITCWPKPTRNDGSVYGGPKETDWDDFRPKERD